MCHKVYEMVKGTNAVYRKRHPSHHDHTLYSLPSFMPEGRGTFIRYRDDCGVPSYLHALCPRRPHHLKDTLHCAFSQTEPRDQPRLRAPRHKRTTGSSITNGATHHYHIIHSPFCCFVHVRTSPLHREDAFAAGKVLLQYFVSSYGLLCCLLRSLAREAEIIRYCLYVHRQTRLACASFQGFAIH